MVALLYAFFFLSGAAALVYQVAWVRSLGLVFGASHLAVSTVLAVFMGGLALGGGLFGRRADRTGRPLRMYGAVELGIGASALVFLGLTEIYPALYAQAARLGEGRLYLTAVRVVFAVFAMIVPTTLMGATLPVMSRFIARRSEALGRHVSFLYGLNTLGAVAGSLAAGFGLLRTLGVTRSVFVAVAVNVVIGLGALLIPERLFVRERGRPEGADRKLPLHAERLEPAGAADRGALTDRTYRLVLWAIGVSGFCALGYEVLWTRMLSMVVGTSTYSFTIILVSFLAGIALGSHALGATPLANERRTRPARAVLALGLVEVGIGVAALGVTVLMRDLPTHALALQNLIAPGRSEFVARQGASFAVAFAYVFLPAFLGGVAFPLAGTIQALRQRSVGTAIGETLTYNTIGSIAGSAASGFVLVYAFGAERSLQLLALLNVTAGCVVVASLTRRRAVVWAVAGCAAGVAAALVAFPRWGRAWDEKYFAIYRNNQRGAFDEEREREDALQNTDVLYYFEGVNETISVIRPKGAPQAFIVNARSEATTTPGDVQCQRALGHVPMLLHPAPRKVFVLGTGTGMTLGATSIHPEVERIVLAEIEPGVLGATRTFGEFNHHVLDNPKLRVVFNDGRNFLNTTDERFDVITADPIHPWSGGASYLYTTEYFATVARRLNPGGIATQWLPLYELTVSDVATVARTFAENFRYVLVWRTYWDAELVGSNDPIVIDEAALARRLANPAIANDLAFVDMGTPEDFLSYFLMGTDRVREFGALGVVNTDDNLHLEFSAPESMGVGRLLGELAVELGRRREGLLPYLAQAPDEGGRAAQQRRWERNLRAAREYDRAHALMLLGRSTSPEFAALSARLDREFPDYAPSRFLRKDVERGRAAEPRLTAAARFPIVTADGRDWYVELSAVTMKIGDSRAAVVFVDNDRREIYGQRYLDALPAEIDAAAKRFAEETLAAVRAEYLAAFGEAAGGLARRPDERMATTRLRLSVAERVAVAGKDEAR